MSAALTSPSESALRDAIGLARSLLAAGQRPTAIEALRAGLWPDADFVLQRRAARLLTPSPGDTGLRRLRVAVLATSTVDGLIDLLPLWLALHGIDAELMLAPYDSIEQTVLDPASPMYAFQPQLVWLFTTTDDVELSVSPAAAAVDIEAAVIAEVELRAQLWQVLQQRLSCRVLQNNAELPVDDPQGHLSGAVPWGRRSLLRRYNVALTAAAPAGVVVFDLDHLAASWGQERWRDARLWYHAKQAFCQQVTGRIAWQAARVVAAMLGLSRKCLVLDLDNTLWGGVIGDDGLAGIALGDGADGEAFVAFQEYVRSLRRRGVVLAVCSKNDEATARLPFEQHPDMRLKLDEVAVFCANWQDKASNLRAIAERLGLGLEALVFVDDNPAERELVRQQLPMVQVIELPEDPALYLQTLARAGCFEATGFSAEDAERARHYTDNARREAARQQQPDLSSYLSSLQMQAEVAAADAISLPRIGQLIGKSNQFHLTGLRPGEAELRDLSAREDHRVIGVRLRDRFGDNGLVSALLLRRKEARLHIDVWVMSCRVLGRRLEEFVANQILRVAVDWGCSEVVGRYVASPRNALVADLYPRLGFESFDEGQWRLAVPAELPHWDSPISAPCNPTAQEMPT